jgi:hypothetical protein
MIRPLAALSLALLIAACGQQPKPAADDSRSAEGQVLGGTISDAMLPLDTVTSQPPPMPAGAAEGDAEESPGETATGPAADATPTPEASAPATAAPKPSPTPKPSASADE